MSPDVDNLAVFVFGQIQGHHVKAQILSGLGRSKEVLKEFIYCLALNPECNSARKETQKVCVLVNDFLLQVLTCGVMSCQEPLPVRATRVISYAHNSAVSDTVVIRATFDDL